MITYEEWLDNPTELLIHTNQELVDHPELRYNGWINPWTLTTEELDKIREEFDGSAREWRDYVAMNIPTLNYKEEYRKKVKLNEIKDASRCGKTMIRIGKNGLPEIQIYRCKRYHICSKCKHEKEKETKTRLRSMDGCRYVLADSDHRAILIDKYGKDKVYAKNIDEKISLVVIDTNDPIGAEFTYDHAVQYCNLSPRGTKTSGKLGKIESSILDKEDDSEAFQAERGEYLIEAPKKVIDEIRAEYMEKSIDICPKNEKEYQAAIDLCEIIFLEVCTKHCAKIHFLRRTKFQFTKNDSNWSERRLTIKTRLRNLSTA